ncbi:MAG: hypothetical protein ACLFOY_04570 [Desulfatibacillaceae bacterium]
MVKRIVVGILLLALGLGVGLGIGKWRLDNERAANDAQVSRLEKKIAAYHKKYIEKSALVDGMMRAERAIKGRLAQAEQAARDLEEDLVLLEEDYREDVDVLDAGIREHKKTIALKELRIAELGEQIIAAGDRIREKDSEIREMKQLVAKTLAEHEATVAELEADVMKRDARIEHCRQNNTKLVSISRDLLEHYQNKGLVDSIMQKEPFTQVKQVEVENLMREYSDRIDKESLGRDEAGS